MLYRIIVIKLNARHWTQIKEKWKNLINQDNKSFPLCCLNCAEMDLSQTA